MKKSIAIIITTLLVLTLFSACMANKADETLSPNPPTQGSTKASAADEVTEEIKTTLPEKTEKQEEKNTAAPQKEAEKATAGTKAVVTEKKAQQNKPTEKIAAAKPVATTKKEFNISKDEAKTIALSHAGLAETDISRYKSELDRERKAIVYEIEFDSGKYEYEYEINADTGKIIKAEKEFRD